jgi:hypothetical protein
MWNNWMTKNIAESNPNGKYATAVLICQIVIGYSCLNSGLFNWRDLTVCPTSRRGHL